MEVPLRNLYNQAGVSNPWSPPTTLGGWAKFDHLKQFKTEGENDERMGEDRRCRKKKEGEEEEEWWGWDWQQTSANLFSDQDHQTEQLS